MASSPFKACLSITQTSPGSRDCPSNIATDSESANIDIAKYRLSKSHALLRKQLQRHEVDQRQFSRRRFTFSGQPERVLCKKRRRFTSVALPTKFLLGGNITDPLNLRSLEDDAINQQLNAFTPVSSPMPMPISRHRNQVQVLIPPNIYDPLNLNSGEDIAFNLFSAKPRKRRRHRKSRREEHESIISVPLKDITHFDSPKAEKNLESLPVVEQDKDSKVLPVTQSTSEERATADKIVSPVVPQGSPAKFYKRFHSRSFSKEIEEKTPSSKLTKQKPSKSSRSVCSESVKVKPNSEYFRYGNCVIDNLDWNSFEIEDQRLRFFNKELFQGKNILDIGSNTGNIALFISKYLEPSKVIGIDIDKRLIDIAKRNLNKHLSESIAQNIDFPSSLSVMYGPLAKLTFTHDNYEHKTFPCNVTFIEANYVPSCEEQLRGQKPEFDIVLCLRVTKWIHLNWGDKGLKLAFKRMFTQLHAGGHLILEAQPWFTYSSKKKITPAIYENYCAIELKPEKFCEYLLSKEIGFNRCEFIGCTTVNCKKEYQQPLYLLTKEFEFDPACQSSEQHIDMLPPIPYYPSDWHHPEEQESCSMWHHESEMNPNYSSDILPHDL